MVATLYDQLSTWAANRLLDHLLGVEAWEAPEEIWLALYSTPPGEEDEGTEISDPGYARQQLTFGPAADGIAATTAAVTFGPFTTAVTITHWGIRDAESGGNLLVHGPLVDEIEVGDATTVFNITVDGCLVTYTYAGSGTDPEIAWDAPAPGHAVVITSSNFEAANTGRFVVVASGEDYFTVANEDGVAQAGVALGSGGSITWLEPAEASLGRRIRLTFGAGGITVRLS